MGVLWVSVDYGSGVATADEQARFLDAVATINGAFGSYGVELVPVDVATPDENIRIHIGSSSPLGGATQGLLGYTTAARDISIIDAWNWYTGADALAVGSQRYDYQTVLVHELGHSIGLEHSPDIASVMYGLLPAGLARRNFTQQDLSHLGQVAGAGGEEGSGHALMAETAPLLAATSRDEDNNAVPSMHRIGSLAFNSQKAIIDLASTKAPDARVLSSGFPSSSVADGSIFGTKRIIGNMDGLITKHRNVLE